MTALLSLAHVSKRFVRPAGLGDRIAGLFGAGRGPQVVHAVTDVSLAVDRQEVLGLVGESGCGKSTLGRMAAGVYAPTEGTVLLDGAMLRSRGRKLTPRVQMIHQDRSRYLGSLVLPSERGDFQRFREPALLADALSK